MVVKTLCLQTHLVYFVAIGLVTDVSTSWKGTTVHGTTMLHRKPDMV